LWVKVKILFRKKSRAGWSQGVQNAESFVFQFPIQKFRDSGIQNYNFSCCFVWVWNLVTHIEGGTQAEGAFVKNVIILRMPHKTENWLLNEALPCHGILLLLLLLLLLLTAWIFTRWQCATMRDRKIRYSSAQYTTTQYNNNTSHKIIYNTQCNPLYAKLQQKSRTRIILF